jgi:hypothetical protein
VPDAPAVYFVLPSQENVEKIAQVMSCLVAECNVLSEFCFGLGLRCEFV